MAYHFINLDFKDDVDNVPYKHLVTLFEFSKVLAPYQRVDIDLNANSIRLRTYTYFFNIVDKIESLFRLEVITPEMIEMYKWFSKNTIISSECWNVNDNDFGPDNWEELDKPLKELRDKYMPE